MKQITPEKDQDRVSIIVITFALIIFIYLQFTKEDRQKAEKKQRLKMAFEGYVTNIILDSLSDYPRKTLKRTLILNDTLFIIDEKNEFFFDKVNLGDYLVKKENDSMARINATFYNYLENYNPN